MMTNYERIKSMDKDELAIFLYGFPDNTNICGKNKDTCSERNCNECFREWLDDESKPKIADCPLCNAICTWKDTDKDDGYIVCTNSFCLCRSTSIKETCLTKEGIIERWNDR